jgi:hypothetical protein
MAMEYRKTTSLVHFNSKLEAANLMAIEFGAVEIEEGRFIVEDVNSKARKAVAGAYDAGGDTQVFLNFLDSAHGSVKDTDVNPFDESAPVLKQGSGGFSGIVGSGLPIGINKKYWDVVGTPAVGDAVIIGTDAKPKNTPLSAMAAKVPYFGMVYKINDEVIWFIFESVGVVI